MPRLSIEALSLLPSAQEISACVINEMERVEILLGKNISAVQGYMLDNNQLSDLPIGSSLDAQTGTFSWIPGPGFLGRYALVFVVTDNDGYTFKQLVETVIRPKFE